MGKEYLDYLENEVKLRATQLELTSNDHQDLECLICGNIFNATVKAKVTNHRKYGAKGCPDCTKIARYKDTIENNVTKLKEKFDFEVPEIWKNEIKLSVTNKECGHTFTSKLGNLLNRGVNCPVCNVEVKRERCLNNNERKYQESLVYKKDFDLYRSVVENETKKNYKKYKHILNPDNLPRVQAKAGNVGYHLDHIASRSYCFHNGIPPEVCADYRNLRLITWKENVEKHNLVDEEEIPDFIREMVENG